VISIDTRNSLVRASERRLIATIGVEDLVVVDTPDATLISRKDRVQDVKAMSSGSSATDAGAPVPPQGVPPVGQLRFDRCRRKVPGQAHRREARRPAEPAEHARRAEHWVVVSGVAEVTCDDRVFDLRENESTYIPLGSVHRLRNRGTEPVELIEVQSGGYLGEDDIERLEDVYGRT
jgi:mannose-1-phosphate guanylyltransferase/mannose-6-phosphate isomerase